MASLKKLMNLSKKINKENTLRKQLMDTAGVSGTEAQSMLEGASAAARSNFNVEQRTDKYMKMSDFADTFSNAGVRDTLKNAAWVNQVADPEWFESTDENVKDLLFGGAPTGGQFSQYSREAFDKYAAAQAAENSLRTSYTAALRSGNEGAKTYLESGFGNAQDAEQDLAFAADMASFSSPKAKQAFLDLYGYDPEKLRDDGTPYAADSIYDPYSAKMRDAWQISGSKMGFTEWAQSDEGTQDLAIYNEDVNRRRALSDYFHDHMPGNPYIDPEKLPSEMAASWWEDTGQHIDKYRTQVLGSQISRDEQGFLTTGEGEQLTDTSQYGTDTTPQEEPLPNQDSSFDPANPTGVQNTPIPNTQPTQSTGSTEQTYRPQEQPMSDNTFLGVTIPGYSSSTGEVTPQGQVTTKGGGRSWKDMMQSGGQSVIEKRDAASTGSDILDDYGVDRSAFEAPVNQQLWRAVNNAGVQRAMGLDLGRLSQQNIDPLRTRDQYATRANQMALVSQLQDRIQGKAPSVAQLQMRQGMEAQIKAAQAMAATQAGMSPALAQRQAMRAGQQAMTGNIQQTAMLRAQEQAQAEQLLASQLQGIRGDDQKMMAAMRMASAEDAAMRQRIEAGNLAQKAAELQMQNQMRSYYENRAYDTSASQAASNQALEMMKLKAGLGKDNISIQQELADIQRRQGELQLGGAISSGIATLGVPIIEKGFDKLFGD